MLKRAKVLQELQNLAPKIFSYRQKELLQFASAWSKIKNQEIDNAALLEKACAQKLATWSESLYRNSTLNGRITDYIVLAIDGSQIYPDRHQGIPCYMLNTAIAQFKYTKDFGQAKLDSHPEVFFIENNEEDFENINEIVNCQRAERELQFGLELSNRAKLDSPELPVICLLDGSLIFWNLESKDEKLKLRFLESYLDVLNNFYKNRIPIFGYISLPRNRDLINIIKLSDPALSAKYIVDADFLQTNLAPFDTSTIFKSNIALSSLYPVALRPHFIYMSTQHEIVRIEFPQWLTEDKTLLVSCLLIIKDQVEKGMGYPISCAEAHEEAVIKNLERDFFYDSLQKIFIGKNQKYQISQKSLKKKVLGI